MSVIVMQVESVKDHSNADSLKVYQFVAPNHDKTQIIANLENIYEPGDLVYVALEGAKLKDGLKIKAAKIRNEPSFGMALGKVTDGEKIGDDVTDKFCVKEENQVENDPLLKTAKFVSWTSIESFYNIKRDLYKRFQTPKITYRPKIKLDGTNAAVHIYPDGSVAVQKRSSIITTRNDNQGFAKWVVDRFDYFSSIKKGPAIIYGEFAGKGIQKHCAISKINKKIFAPFAILFLETRVLEFEPQFIKQFMPDHDDIYVLPWHSDPIEIDFGNTIQLQESVAKIGRSVIDVENSDPWVKENFGVEGLAEGFVYYPVGINNYFEFSNYVFKAKGEKHQVKNTKENKVKIQIDPDVLSNIKEFIDMFVTENRLEQAVQEACNGEYDHKLIGKFAKWMSDDIKKESRDELEVSKLTWDDVRKQINHTCVSWYKTKIMTGS